MDCPFCGSAKTDIFNSRPTHFKQQIWRRRRCLSCKESFTTYEQIDLSFIRVIKRSGRKERYSRTKLFASLANAFSGLPQHQTDGLVETIETKLLKRRQGLITSVDIAKTVLGVLKRFNTAAFIRYLALQTDVSSKAKLKQALRQY